MDFQKLLLDVGKALSRDDIKALAFLCTDLLGRNPNSVESASDLFSRLEDQDRLSSEKPHLLKELLLTIQRHRLVRELRLSDLATTSLISPYRKLLYYLSEEITDDLLREVKFLLNKALPRRKLEDNVTTLEVFMEMEHLDVISDTNLDTLENIFQSVCPMLNGEIRRYKAQQVPNTNLIAQEMSRPRSSSFPSQTSTSLPRTGSIEMQAFPPLAICPMNSSKTSVDLFHGGDECEALAQNLSSLHTEARRCASLEEVKHYALEYSSSQENTNSSGKQTSQTTNTHTEGLGTYPMTSAKRGICLIINNYNFSESRVELKKREGTMIDEKCLQEVFEWLGFEVQTHRDCGKRQILSLVSELSRRDHSQMDCFVCCVLSHGLEGAVYGVDGQEVKLRQLTDPFDGLNCPSLAEKPKLFFIQACQGSVEQRAVYIEADSGAPSRICSDAVRARDSIPSKADVLLGMATVPLFVSYRDKTNGAWFIQSLCQNLVQMVPRECDLVSIMTKVNADVSKKNAGSYKQMPQPSFSLRKKVVFPVPKSSPPNLRPELQVCSHNK
ncbi:caspase-8 [Amphiprion ocellaris]|uniref:Caspase-8 n=1 Tax=Amphiprion ocellaris TaxID=80972 RepID=A0A3Q1CV59_AMPOC|nr:caspase-8 [Amphiprion ocellaris]